MRSGRRRVGAGGSRGRVDVALAAPAEHVGVALAGALAATVEEQHAVAVPHEHPGLRLGPDALRPGTRMTAAPFFEGTYQPCR